MHVFGLVQPTVFDGSGQRNSDQCIKCKFM